MSPRAVSLPVVLLLLLVACGGGTAADPTTTDSGAADPESGASAGPFGAGSFGYAASSDLAVGRERLLIAITNDDGARLPSPDVPIDVVVWLEDREFQQQTLPASFFWAIPDVSGLYRATADFDVAGTWFVGVVPRGGEPLSAFPITVREEALTPVAGDPAPRSETLTVDDAPLEELTTDVDPDPRLYELSVAEAVTSGKPSVIVFATPRFCTTGICQPTMETVRELLPEYPNANFVHVEVFTNLDDPENLELAPGIEEWGLPTEPWVFVVDETGTVVGRFEGVVTDEELAELLG